VTELRQQLLSCDQALAAAQQSAQRQQEEQERLVARLSAVQGDCSRLQGQLEGQTAARRAAEDQVRPLRWEFNSCWGQEWGFFKEEGS
jgi:chromosome segregation ATPase